MANIKDLFIKCSKILIFYKIEVFEDFDFIENSNLRRLRTVAKLVRSLRRFDTIYLYW